MAHQVNNNNKHATMNWQTMKDTANLKDGEQIVVRVTWDINPRPSYTIGTMFNGTPLVPGREYNLDCFRKEWCHINNEASRWNDMSTLAEAPACQPILLRYERHGKERFQIVYKSFGGDVSYPPSPERLGWMMLSDYIGRAI
jgi:hypothetical protein